MEEFVLRLFVFSLLCLHALRKEVAPLCTSVLSFPSVLNYFFPLVRTWLKVRKALLFHTCALFVCGFKLCF